MASSWTRMVAAVLGIGSFGVATSAFALKQPNNVVIPVGDGLQSMFTSRGEGIDALADAQAVPETYLPTCKLTFEVLQRNAGYKNAFGWYNVTGQKPALADLHEFLSCNDGVGTKKVLEIKKDPAYLGGAIGFFQATGGCASVQNHDSIFFSEKKYNPDGDQQNPYIHLLIYNSAVVPKAFYFGWEDLLVGGDNDFDDLTTFVSGIGCSGSGAKCDTGKKGVCAEGTRQCQNGQLACVDLAAPSKETCDGYDNDCNGLPDDGDLCPDGDVCDKGHCVPRCGSGEFTCAPGTTCNMAGLCVDPSCANVTCPDNTRCTLGKCVAACDGVVCPFGQECVAGACLDPCSKFTCDDSQVCVKGACIDKCDCAGCAKGDTCQPDGRCIPALCAMVSCPAGKHCDPKGVCVDDCEGANCPSGSTCLLGQCVETPSAGAGGMGGTSGTGNLVGGGSPVGTGTSAGGAGQGGSGGGAFTVPSSGCGCHVERAEDGMARAMFGVGFVWLVARMRRRRR